MIPAVIALSSTWGIDKNALKFMAQGKILSRITRCHSISDTEAFEIELQHRDAFAMPVISHDEPLILHQLGDMRGLAARGRTQVADQFSGLWIES